MHAARNTQEANAKVCWNGITEIVERRGENNMSNFKPHYKRCLRCDEKDKCQGMCVDACADEVFKIEMRKEKLKESELDLYTTRRIQKYVKLKRRR